MCFGLIRGWVAHTLCHDYHFRWTPPLLQIVTTVSRGVHAVLKVKYLGASGADGATPTAGGVYKALKALPLDQVRQLQREVNHTHVHMRAQRFAMSLFTHTYVLHLVCTGGFCRVYYMYPRCATAGADSKPPAPHVHHASGGGVRSRPSARVCTPTQPPHLPTTTATTTTPVDHHLLA